MTLSRHGRSLRLRVEQFLADLTIYQLGEGPYLSKVAHLSGMAHLGVCNPEGYILSKVAHLSEMAHLGVCNPEGYILSKVAHLSETAYLGVSGQLIVAPRGMKSIAVDAIQNSSFYGT